MRVTVLVARFSTTCGWYVVFVALPSLSVPTTPTGCGSPTKSGSGWKVIVPSGFIV